MRDVAPAAPPGLRGEDWIAAVSHDLRDPMNVVVGMTRLLLETPLDAEQRGFAEAIDDAAHSMLTLVNDLLDTSRLAHGELVVRAEPFDLRRLIARSVDMVRPRLEGGRVRLEVSVAAAAPAWVAGDAGRVRQVLVNLLANAVKFTPAGEVRLTVTPAGGDRLRFEVADTGPGVPPELRARIFEPFVRGHGTTGGGLGLGLAIVRRVVTALGGEIRLEDDRGSGSVFALTLPLPRAPAAAPSPRAAVAGRAVWLVAEATPRRERTAARLRTLGLELTTLDATAAADAAVEEAADAAVGEAAAPDAVFIGAATPAPEAKALVGLLRRRWPATPLLALAGSGLRGEAAAWRRLGVDGYLPDAAAAEVLADALALVFATGRHDRPFVTAHSLADREAPSLAVLVVDDNAMNLRLAAILLERAGHRVTTAEDGAAAWRRVAAGGIDAVVMDVQMPGMDGLEATRRIRSLPGAAGGTPVVALTANASKRECAACREAGMDDVVTKPVEREAMLEALARAVAGRG